MNPCPRCGRSPVEVTRMASPDPEWLPACSCYPHPPRCVSCHADLLDGLCANTKCGVYGALQPLPDVDPLWPTG